MTCVLYNTVICCTLVLMYRYDILVLFCCTPCSPPRPGTPLHGTRHSSHQRQELWEESHEADLQTVLAHTKNHLQATK